MKAPRSVGSRSGSARPASMREKSSRVLTSFCRRSALRKTTVRRSLLLAVGGVAQRVLGRAEDQRQRRAELVADVGEEVGLRAVELGQRLGPLALGLARAHAARGSRRSGRRRARGSRGRPRRAGGTGSAPRRRSRPPARAPARAARSPPRGGARSARRPSASTRGPRARRRPGRGPTRGDRPARRRATWAEDADRARRGPRRRAGRRARTAGPRGLRARLRSIAANSSCSVSHAPTADARSRSVAIRRAPITPVGLLDHDAEHPGGVAVVVGERAVGERVVGLLRVAAALQEQLQRLVPRGVARLHHLLDARADVRPDLRPHLVRRPAERPRVLGAQRVVAVGVVVEERELRPPRHPHREARGEHDPHGGPEARRPAGRRPQRRRGPVEGVDPLAHAVVGGRLRKRSAHGPEPIRARGPPGAPPATGSPRSSR